MKLSGCAFSIVIEKRMMFEPKPHEPRQLVDGLFVFIEGSCYTTHRLGSSWQYNIQGFDASPFFYQVGSRPPDAQLSASHGCRLRRPSPYHAHSRSPSGHSIS
ncbi:hypothetical protein COMA2_150110 [Candidatus Nitrospira nitrificans]|uniref:Uncharacterized protein n=1 Tax=Candidatus Nitrospira nitrificans TaxID=1742973 RepID=A0A0S4LDW9_9BACT|nr:hypothetical protein COMA2_150110 [Candidatus Nitrospira nitrificans]